MNASKELECNKESMVPPEGHGDKEQETLTEARARVEQLWRTILGTGNNNSEGMKEPRSQRGGKITLDNWDEPVEMERHPPFTSSTSSQDLRQPLESTAKMQRPPHPVKDLYHESQLPYLDSSTQSLSDSPTYANFLYGPCTPVRPNDVPLRPTPTHISSSSFGAHNDLLMNLSFSTAVPASKKKNLDDVAALLGQQVGNNCPRSSQFLTSIIASMKKAVEEHRSGSGVSLGLSSDFDEEEEEAAPNQEQVSDEQEHLKAAITEHPLYPSMVLAHIQILKIGAPSGLQVKLDEISKKYQRFEVPEESKLGQDPELDHFMRSYTELLTKFREDFEEPYNKMMQFMDNATKDLEDICGHYVEAKPEEEDNYGYDIEPEILSQDSDLQEMLEKNLRNPRDVDKSIVVDPNASEEELKKVLRKKYGRHLGGLKAEFNRVRKKGKLPNASRQILKDWFNHHSYWPYPSEMEKEYLQQLCNMDLKQINNWFINERKRHWNSEEKCMSDPNTEYYDVRASPNGEHPKSQA